MLNVIFSQRPEAGGAAAGEEGAHGGQETGGKDVNWNRQVEDDDEGLQALDQNIVTRFQHWLLTIRIKPEKLYHKLFFI